MADELLKNLAHFICRECANDPAKLGKVRLQKILFLTDLEKFKLTTETLTDSQYRKYPFGPFNDRLDSALDELSEEGRLTVITRSGGDEFDTVGLIGRGAPDVSAFDERDIRRVRRIIEDVCSLSATEISERTHGPIWQMAKEREILPFHAYVAFPLIHTTPDDIEFAKLLNV